MVNRRVELIAEVATNHGGDVALAKEFIREFAENGADWIKFQFTRVAHLRKDDPQYAWFEQAELSVPAFRELQSECHRLGVGFLLTVYHADDVEAVASLGVDAVKVGSGEAGERSVAHAIQGSDIPRVLVSCGIVPLKTSVALWHPGSQQVQFLRCTSRYPCPSGSACGDYGLYSGWSDHCVGMEGAQIAILHGATIIEKHVCLGNQARRIQPWEAAPQDFLMLRRFADDDPERFLGRWQAA